MTPGHPLSRPFERNVRAFGKHLPGAIAGEVEALHQTRVATRRLREILPLCASEVSRSTTARARRRLRRMGRALGPVREVDVAIEVLDELAAERVVAGETKERLRKHLANERDERREQMLDRLGSVNTRKLERDLADIARVLGMRQQTDAWAYTLATRMRTRAQHLRETIGAAGPLYVAERVHRVRIAAKKLRYALEFAVDTGEARVKGAVRQVKEVQDVLGRLHDLDVLAILVRDLPIPAVDESSSDDDDLEAMQFWLEKACRELHGRYVSRQMALLDICVAATRAAERIRSHRGGSLMTEPHLRPVGRVLKMRLERTLPTEHEVKGRR